MMPFEDPFGPRDGIIRAIGQANESLVVYPYRESPPALSLALVTMLCPIAKRFVNPSQHDLTDVGLP